MKEELINIGFNKREAEIYLALLSFGTTAASTLSKELSLDRRTIYDNLDIMAKKGFIIKTKIKNILHYESINPEDLKEDFKQKFKDYEKILPKLNELKQKEVKSEYKIWFGVPAVTRIINNAFKTNEEILLMGRGGYLIDQLKESRYQYIPKLKKLNWKMIQTGDYKKNLHKQEFIPRKIKYLPSDLNLNTAFIVFEDKVYLFTKKQEIEIMEIISKPFANTFKTYFNLFWKLAK